MTGTAGIISEYNPFHNGHLYHIRQTRRKGGFDSVVCIMSGNFVQRGGPAIVNKFVRAGCAVAGGADLVLELPFPYANASAGIFAAGAVKVLDALGIIDCLSFGSESGDLKSLVQVADLLAGEPEEFRRSLRRHLKADLSFAAARQVAVAELLPESAALLSSPNDILGIEYIKALKTHNSRMVPMTILRQGAGDREITVSGRLSSATAIRNLIHDRSSGILPGERDDKGDWGFLDEYMPGPCQTALQEAFLAGSGPVDLEDFSTVILSVLRRMTPEETAALPDVSEGLENRLKTAAVNSATAADLVRLAGTRRYPDSRIRRIMISALAGMQKEDQRVINADLVRVLAFNDKGRDLIRKINSVNRQSAVSERPECTEEHQGAGCGGLLLITGSTAPVLRRKGEFRAEVLRQLELGRLASDLYALGVPDPGLRVGGQDKRAALYRPHYPADFSN
ncbi:MAG TPA: hypothetical protein DD727_00925 [Clostridiales bacterium]|nr:hypothetical protein [Clostridiales bacterium]